MVTSFSIDTGQLVKYDSIVHVYEQLQTQAECTHVMSVYRSRTSGQIEAMTHIYCVGHPVLMRLLYLIEYTKFLPWLTKDQFFPHLYVCAD